MDVVVFDVYFIYIRSTYTQTILEIHESWLREKGGGFPDQGTIANNGSSGGEAGHVVRPKAMHEAGSMENMETIEPFFSHTFTRSLRNFIG